MSRSRMSLGGAVLVLLLGGFGGIRWYRSGSAPSPVVVTRFSTRDFHAKPADAPIGGARLAPAVTASAADRGAEPAGSAVPHLSPTVAGAIIVHVVGAVRKPGVYPLAPKARLVDAVHAAGGAKAGADLEAVNLASFAHDGEQIWVPALAERPLPQAPVAAIPSMPLVSSREPARRPVRSLAHYPLAEPAQTAVASAAGVSSRAAGAKGGGPVNINTADAAGLTALPGVGPKTAAAILAYRQEHGPFQRAEDLMEVRGIGAKKLARMRAQVVVR